MKIVDRAIENVLISRSKQFPVVTITGPRQSGKTTLVRKVFPHKTYLTLEDPDVRSLAQSDPRGFLAQNKSGLVLDEIQRVPELLSYIQGIVDETKEAGQFILTGSQQFSLMKGVAQSLAGRTALLKLLPFTRQETAQFEPITGDILLRKGFFPRVWSEKVDIHATYSAYFETYIQRDLRALIRVKDLAMFQKFVRLCAGRVGQVWVASHLSNDLGVTVSTIQEWLSILQASYIVYLLEPYYENIGKRLIKSPKLYFYDTGLVCYLLGLERDEQLARDPVRGYLVENYAVMELLKSRYNQGQDSNLFYFRDQQHHEIDILIKNGRELTTLEVKAGQTFQSEMVKHLQYLKTLLPDAVVDQYLLYTGAREFEYKGIKVRDVFGLPSFTGKLLVSSI